MWSCASVVIKTHKQKLDQNRGNKLHKDIHIESIFRSIITKLTVEGVSCNIQILSSRKAILSTKYRSCDKT